MGLGAISDPSAADVSSSMPWLGAENRGMAATADGLAVAEPGSPPARLMVGQLTIY